jgi:hypothetical protein
MLATTDSKNQAVSKLESLIECGRSRAANVIDHVMRTSRPIAWSGVMPCNSAPRTTCLKS